MLLYKLVFKRVERRAEKSRLKRCRGNVVFVGAEKALVEVKLFEFLGVSESEEVGVEQEIAQPSCRTVHLSEPSVGDVALRRYAEMKQFKIFF